VKSQLLDNVLEWVVPDREHCRKAAADFAAQHPGKTPEELAKKAIGSAQGWAAAAGGATGAAANPLIMVPAALADMAAVLRIEGVMAGTVAALLDPDSLDDPRKFQADVVTIIFPGAVSQALRQVGVRWGQQLTQELIRRYFTEGLMKSVTGLASKYLFVHVTEKALVSKTVPIIGAGIGAGWNYLELKAVGNRAVRYFQQKGIGPRQKSGKSGRVKSVASRVVRGRKGDKGKRLP
jgi:hypothetical protein